MKQLKLFSILAILGLLLSSCAPGTLERQSQQHMGQMMHSDSRLIESTQFSQDISGLSTAKKTSTMMPRDGETIKLSADIVKKKIDGREVRMFGYNGQIPGPLIKVKKGSTLWVEFTNNLDMETTIHWHGIRVENKYDGVPSVTQPEVKPGETYRYKLTFPDEGMFWYHPHLREDYQQELGLYGNILVMENDVNIPANREEAIFLDDISLDSNGIVPFFAERITNALMGRFGNVMLVNGDTNFQLPAKKGEVLRFYLTNSANTRTFNVGFGGGKMKLVGADQGAYEKEEFVTSVILAPSERAIVDVYFDTEGIFQLTHTTPSKKYTMGAITVEGNQNGQNYADEFGTLRENEAKKAEFAELRKYTQKTPDVTLRMDFSAGGMGMRMGSPEEDGIEWEDPAPQMNAMMTNISAVWFFEDKKTGRRNMDIDHNWKRGEKVKIRLFNDPKTMHPMQHPIHFHGQRFVVLAVDGKPNENMVWKDTVLVPSGSTVDILLEISNPGDWMAHCHIAEHLQAGMMTSFSVSY